MLLMISEMSRVCILQKSRSAMEAIRGLYGVLAIFCFLIWVLTSQLGSISKNLWNSTLMIYVLSVSMLYLNEKFTWKKKKVQTEMAWLFSHLKMTSHVGINPTCYLVQFSQEYHIVYFHVDQIISISLSRCYWLFFHVVFIIFK